VGRPVPARLPPDTARSTVPRLGCRLRPFAPKGQLSRSQGPRLRFRSRQDRLEAAAIAWGKRLFPWLKVPELVILTVWNYQCSVGTHMAGSEPQFKRSSPGGNRCGPVFPLPRQPSSSAQDSPRANRCSCSISKPQGNAGAAQPLANAATRA